MEKVKVPLARILTGPGQPAHYTCVGTTLLLTVYKELRPVLWVTQWHGYKAAGVQRQDWSGGSTEDRD